ncbi:unnamed protein product [Allacma fusca]|uniref:Uncharacterized protein n=1 Tax=Allacma fusca TaxID=39272 RepID=A0A8J2KZL9_9HEXA|nr:unnamed protein product [Allacma fusca]
MSLVWSTTLEQRTFSGGFTGLESLAEPRNYMVCIWSSIQYVIVTLLVVTQNAFETSKMKMFIYIAAILFTVSIAEGDRCRFNLPVTSSNIKCENQVYHRTPSAIAAVNACGEGKNGSEITIADTDCIFERLGYIYDGKLQPHILLAVNKINFPHHYEALTKGTTACAAANTKETDDVDPFKHVECRLRVFKEVCKHETCDWMNTFD